MVKNKCLQKSIFKETAKNKKERKKERKKETELKYAMYAKESSIKIISIVQE